MDLFPIVLTNRDMDILMRVVEEHGDEILLSFIPDFEDIGSIDEAKARIAQLNRREMDNFLREFSRILASMLEEGGPIVSVPVEGGFIPDQRQLEAVVSLRKAIAVLHSLRGRIRRSR